MTNPSPICLVDGYATTNGVDVTAGATVTIALADTAGVAQWNLSCLYTDEDNSAATINSGLSVNLVNKTATFTAPATLGSALIFQSKVNNGIDLNGVAQSSYVTTFKVSVLAVNGLRVVALNETTENHASFGWTGIVNSGVRTALTAASAGAGLSASGNILNVGQNADNTITVNANDIQLTPSFYTPYPINGKLAQRDPTYGFIHLNDVVGSARYGGSILVSELTPFSISQTGRTSDADAKDLTFTSQAPFATATGTNRLPGDIILSTPAAVGALATTDSGKVILKTGSTEYAHFSVIPSSTTATLSFANNGIVTAVTSLNVNCTSLTLGGDTVSITNNTSTSIDGNNCNFSLAGSMTATVDGNITFTSTINSFTGGFNVNDTAGQGVYITGGGGDFQFSNSAGVQILGPSINLNHATPGSDITLQVGDNGTTDGEGLIVAAGAAATAGGIGGGLSLKAGTGSNFSGNIGINMTAPAGDSNNGHLCIYIAQTNAAPISNPTGGIVLYVDTSGNLKARTSAGNIRTIAAV